MRNRNVLWALMAMVLLILDSRCAVRSAREALELCSRTLIPSLFPLFVLSGLSVPGLLGVRIPVLARLLGLPGGAEGIFLLGCAGGFPMGAAAIAQCARSGSLGKKDARRMLGLCSCCGPAFLFGVGPRFLPMERVAALFVLQLETVLLLGSLWPGGSEWTLRPQQEDISLPEAVRRAVRSMTSVCAWVVLAGVAAGSLRRWLFPLLPRELSQLLTGLLELTTGIFALEPGTDRSFLLCAVFVCFGGVSVLLQIGGVAQGLSMKQCVIQKMFHGLLGFAAAWAYLCFGPMFLLLIPGVLFLKMTVEIPGRMLYNTTRKEGI